MCHVAVSLPINFVRVAGMTTHTRLRCHGHERRKGVGDRCNVHSLGWVPVRCRELWYSAVQAAVVQCGAGSCGTVRCRELWYRASLALRHVLAAEAGPRSLVVAHNAVNQAVLCVALGLPPARFRGLVQTNAATSALRFDPSDAVNSDSSSSPQVRRPTQPRTCTEMREGRGNHAKQTCQQSESFCSCLVSLLLTSMCCCCPELQCILLYCHLVGSLRGNSQDPFM